MSVVLMIAMSAIGPASAGTERVSVGPGGVQSNGVSSHATTVGNGRYVGYSSTASNLVSNDTNNVEDVFFLDRKMGLTSRASVSSSGVQGNAASLKPALTADGRYVLFQSYASNMVAGDTNGKPDVFLRDRKTHTGIAGERQLQWRPSERAERLRLVFT